MIQVGDHPLAAFSVLAVGLEDLEVLVSATVLGKGFEVSKHGASTSLY